MKTTIFDLKRYDKYVSFRIMWLFFCFINIFWNNKNVSIFNIGDGSFGRKLDLVASLEIWSGYIPSVFKNYLKYHKIIIEIIRNAFIIEACIPLKILCIAEQRPCIIWFYTCEKFTQNFTLTFDRHFLVGLVFWRVRLYIY